jgi:hypothetical protein
VDRGAEGEAVQRLAGGVAGMGVGGHRVSRGA